MQSGDNFTGAASESVALDNFADTEIKALKPGEMFISKGEDVEVKRYAKIAKERALHV